MKRARFHSPTGYAHTGQCCPPPQNVGGTDAFAEGTRPRHLTFGTDSTNTHLRSPTLVFLRSVVHGIYVTAMSLELVAQGSDIGICILLVGLHTR